MHMANARTKIPDNSSHQDKDPCSAAASFGLWWPTPFLSESSGYCRDLYFCGPLQSCYEPCGADQCDSDSIKRHFYRGLVVQVEVIQSTNKWVTDTYTSCLQIQMYLPCLILHALRKHAMVLRVKVGGVVSDGWCVACEAMGGQWRHALTRWHGATKELPETTAW